LALVSAVEPASRRLTIKEYILMKLNRDVTDKLLRLGLRSLTFVPGLELYDLVAQITRSQKDVDAQVNEALESIQKTSALVSQLEVTLKERAVKLEELQKQHEHLSRLTTIEAEQAAALLKQVEDTVGKNVGRERWIAFLINIVAGLILFVLGVALSDKTKAWLSAIWTWMRPFGGED
jgi:hypothetical protein